MGQCDIIVGLQAGSEGKGKIAAMLAPLYDGAVRIGAPNAGHTIIHEGLSYKMRQIPCAWVNKKCKLFIGAGGMVNVDVLHEEIKFLPDDVPQRLKIDRNVAILCPIDRRDEEDTRMNNRIGSTAEGVGPALARKVLRIHGTIARDDQDLQRFVHRVDKELWDILDNDGNIMIEGTQGYELCLNHTRYYPFCTSRDVLASSMLSDVGLSPKDCGEIYGVMRTYPIRVAGNSGPLGKELTWEEVARRSGYSFLEERTTVTKRVRRVFEIDWDMLQDAVRANGVTGIFIMFADYLDSSIAGIGGGMNELNDYDKNDKVCDFIDEVSKRLSVDVMAISTGPKSEHTIWLDNYLECEINNRKLKEVV